MLNEESICFYDQNYLCLKPLSNENILEYFSISQFYNKQSLNEILKMQSQFANIDISNKLTTTPGFYYCLEDSKENFFIIAKKEFDGRKTVICKLYYCIFGYIYCVPTSKMVSDARTADLLYLLNEALNKYEEIKKFDYIKGFNFNTKLKDENFDLKETKFFLEVLHEFNEK